MTEELGEIGKQIISETVQAPKDIVGTALESVGVGGGKKQKKQQTATNLPAGRQAQEAADNQAKSEEVKRAIARAALEELAGVKRQKEPTVWEKIQQEESQKKEQQKAQSAANAKASLPQVSSKRKRGDLFGLKAKKSSTEIGKNTRQD